MELVSEGSFPVGLIPEAIFTATTVNLQTSDTLILFSDGVTEAMDPAEELYGVPRLREVLTGQSECALEKLQKAILESVENFAKGAHQADDLTLLIVRYRSSPAVALTETDLSSSSARSSDRSVASSIIGAGSTPSPSQSSCGASATVSSGAPISNASGSTPKANPSAATIGPT